MPTEIFSAEVIQTLLQMQQTAQQNRTKTVRIDGQAVTVPYPYPSPTDWRNQVIYFLMTDRFNNPLATPKSIWNEKFNYYQGGTFKGVQQQLSYLQQMGVGALWLSPILKNSRPDNFEYTYPGYSTQDFLHLDARFASDGTQTTAEKEFIELVEEAHGRGLYIIVDIVLNHTGRIFDYLYQGTTKDTFTDEKVMTAPLGQEPTIEWLNGFGFPRNDWTNELPPSTQLSGDDAIWPVDLQRKEFFRRRGNKLNDTPTSAGFVPGDFGWMRQLVAEYDATLPGQQEIREKYGIIPVTSILIRIYQYLIAKYDIDGFRIDTVKYVQPDMMETFGNAIREFGLSVGKSNFFTFGEIYDNEETINHFIGRNGGDSEGFGIDAALDFPLFYQLPNIVKGFTEVETLQQVFEERKRVEHGRISSHGEAGRYFVSFLDNHDLHARFNTPDTPFEQITMGLAILMSLQGIPCLYYGTEQGLQGTQDSNGHPTLDSNESVREALWGKLSTAFDLQNSFYLHLQSLIQLRKRTPALCYGRLYFREISGNGIDFGFPQGKGGVIAYSRILTDQEVIVIANTHFTKGFHGSVLVDLDLSRQPRQMKMEYSNMGKSGTQIVHIQQANIYSSSGVVNSRSIAAFSMDLAPMEVQIFIPV